MADLTLEIDASYERLNERLREIKTAIETKRFSIDIGVTGNATSQLDKIQTKLNNIAATLSVISAFKFPALNLGSGPFSVKSSLEFNEKDVERQLGNVSKRASRRKSVEVNASLKVDEASQRDIGAAASNTAKKVQRVLDANHAKVSVDPAKDIARVISKLKQTVSNQLTDIPATVDIGYSSTQAAAVKEAIRASLLGIETTATVKAIPGNVAETKAAIESLAAELSGQKVIFKIGFDEQNAREFGTALAEIRRSTLSSLGGGQEGFPVRINYSEITRASQALTGLTARGENVAENINQSVIREVERVYEIFDDVDKRARDLKNVDTVRITFEAPGLREVQQPLVSVAKSVAALQSLGSVNVSIEPDRIISAAVFADGLLKLLDNIESKSVEINVMAGGVEAVRQQLDDLAAYVNGRTFWMRVGLNKDSLGRAKTEAALFMSEMKGIIKEGGFAPTFTVEIDSGVLTTAKQRATELRTVVATTGRVIEEQLTGGIGQAAANLDEIDRIMEKYSQKGGKKLALSVSTSGASEAIQDLGEMLATIGLIEAASPIEISISRGFFDEVNNVKGFVDSISNADARELPLKFVSNFDEVQKAFNDWAAQEKIVYFTFQSINNPADLGPAGPASGGKTPGGGSRVMPGFVEGISSEAGVSPAAERVILETQAGLSQAVEKGVVESFKARFTERAEIKQGQPGYLTVNALKTLLKEAGVSGYGKAPRAELIEKVKGLDPDQIQQVIDRGIQMRMSGSGGNVSGLTNEIYRRLLNDLASSTISMGGTLGGVSPVPGERRAPKPAWSAPKPGFAPVPSWEGIGLAPWDTSAAGLRGKTPGRVGPIPLSEIDPWDKWSGLAGFPAAKNRSIPTKASINENLDSLLRQFQAKPQLLLPPAREVVPPPPPGRTAPVSSYYPGFGVSGPPALRPLRSEMMPLFPAPRTAAQLYRATFRNREEYPWQPRGSRGFISPYNVPPTSGPASFNFGPGPGLGNIWDEVKDSTGDLKERLDIIASAFNSLSDGELNNFGELLKEFGGAVDAAGSKINNLSEAVNRLGGAAGGAGGGVGSGRGSGGASFSGGPSSPYGIFGGEYRRRGGSSAYQGFELDAGLRVGQARTAALRRTYNADIANIAERELAMRGRTAPPVPTGPLSEEAQQAYSKELQEFEQELNNLQQELREAIPTLGNFEAAARTAAQTLESVQIGSPEERSAIGDYIERQREAEKAASRRTYDIANARADMPGGPAMRDYRQVLQQATTDLENVPRGEEAEAIQKYVRAKELATNAEIQRATAITSEVSARTRGAGGDRLSTYQQAVQNASAVLNQAIKGTSAYDLAVQRLAGTTKDLARAQEDQARELRQATQSFMTPQGRVTRKRREQRLLRAAGESIEGADDFVISAEATRQRRANRRKRNQDIAGEALIGGGFPLLFGAGLGGSVGGGLGGFAGATVSKGGGFPGSIIGSFLGQQIDATVASLGKLATSLKSPTDAIAALEAAGFKVSDSMKFQVDQLISVGRAYEAQSIVFQEVERRLGKGSVQELNALSAEQKKLEETWAEISAELQKNLLPALLGFLRLINAIVDAAGGGKGLLETVDKAASTAMPTRAVGDWISKALRLDTESLQQFIKESNKGAIAAAPERAPLSPQDAYENQKAAFEEAARLEDMRLKVGKDRISIERGAADLVRESRDIEVEAVNYRRQKEDEIRDIRRKTDEAALANVRTEAEIRITAMQNSLTAQGIGKSPETQSLLEGLSQYLSQKAEGEVAIAEERKKIEFEMADIAKQTEDFKIKTQQEIDKFQRQRADYERRVEDYKLMVAEIQLDRAREVARLMMEAASMMSAGASSGGAGGTSMGGLGGIIGRVESSNNYGAYNRGGTHGGEVAINPGVNPAIPGMTIGQIMEKQFAGEYHAVGKYQFIGSTLRGLMQSKGASLGLSTNSKFDAATQDKLAGALAQETVAGAKSATEAMARLRKVWIGLKHVSDSELLPAVEQFMKGGSMGGSGSAAGRYIQGGWGPKGPNAYAPHFDIAQQGGGYFDRNALDRYVSVNGQPLSSGLTVGGGRFGASRDGGAREHRAWDYAFADNAALSLTGGAKWVSNKTGSYGDEAVFQTPDGKIYRIIHGKFQGSTPGAGTAMGATVNTLAGAALKPLPGFPSKPRGMTPDATRLSADYVAEMGKYGAEIGKGLTAKEQLKTLEDEKARNEFIKAQVGTSEVDSLNDQITKQQELNKYSADNLGIGEQSLQIKNLELDAAAKRAGIDRYQQEGIKAINQARKEGKITDEQQLAAASAINEVVQRKGVLLDEETKKRRELLALEQEGATIAGLADTKRGLTQSLDQAAIEQQAAMSGRFEPNAVDAVKAKEAEILRINKELGQTMSANTRSLLDQLYALAEQKDQAQLLLDLTRARAEVQNIGTGVRAGYVGEAGRQYESALSKSGGDTNYAKQMADLAKAGEAQRVMWDGLEQSVLAVGDAISSAMTQGVGDIVTGSKTAQQVLSDMLQGIANAFLSAAQQMLANWMVTKLAGLVGGLFGGGATGLGGVGGGLLSGPGILGGNFLTGGASIPVVPFAEGGFVTRPTPSLLGEGGESEYAIPSSKMDVAMARYSAGARGDAVLDGPIPEGGSEGGTGLFGGGPEPVIRLETTVVNGIEYATVEQMREASRQAAAQGAKMGEQRTLRRMQHSAGTRRRLGL